MALLRRLGRDSLITRMLREERALTAVEILEQMRSAQGTRRASPQTGEVIQGARDAQLREDMEIVRRIGGLS